MIDFLHFYVTPALMTASFLWGFRVCERPFESKPDFYSDLGICVLIASIWPAYWVFTALVLWVRHQPKGK